ncbi:S41 family peptidase [Glaciecola sp. 1036]|uniref:S41 family peptidase n=1 Tax=Alteromonadaceae TaxID=72275 RepID=UPI003CFF5E63
MKLSLVTLATAVILGTSVLTGCGSGSGDSSNNSPINNLPAQNIAVEYQGVWASPANGKVWQITSNNVSGFSYTSDFCIKTDELEGISNAELSTYLRLSADGNSLEEYTLSSQSGFNQLLQTFEKATALPNACINNLVALKGQQGYQYNAERDFDMFYQLFAEHYVDFGLKDVDWPGLYAQIAPLLNTASNEQELFEAIAEMLTPLADSHNSIIFENGTSFNVNNKPLMYQVLIQEYAQNNGLPFPLEEDDLTPAIAAQINQYIDQQIQAFYGVVDGYAENQNQIKTAANGQFVWFETNGVGYLRINNMAYFTEQNDADIPQYLFDAWYEALNEALDQVIDDFANTQGLIIDIRTNGGGQETLSLAIAGRFADQTRHAYSKQTRLGSDKTALNQVFVEPLGDSQYTGNIVVLTSATTTSAGEYFAQTMSVMPHVTLVGEATQGALSTTLDWILPVGFELKLSNQFFYNPQGQWLEGSGISVDVEVPFLELEDRENDIDTAIETAAQLLLQ